MSAPDATVAYRWNDCVIEFHHCRTCGCTTGYDVVGGEPRRAVNARLMAPADVAQLPVRLFDGAVTWRYLD